jgi:glucosamine-6-phosphate deaminase
MNNNLFNHINIDKANTNVPNGLAEDVDAECARYNDVINTLGPIDIQVLGMGHNGHIGFNEPDDHFPLETHKVDLAQSTIDANARFFASADEVPRQALTMGIKTIMQAKKVLVVVSGKDKAEIVKKAFTGPVTPQVPASILQMHSDVILVADEAAASLL